MKTITFFDGPKEVSKVKITSVSFDAETLEPHNHGETRTEIIDLDENVLFQTAKDIWDIEDRYEAFWNRLNELGTGWKPSGIAKVLKIEGLLV